MPRKPTWIEGGLSTLTAVTVGLRLRGRVGRGSGGIQLPSTVHCHVRENGVSVETMTPVMDGGSGPRWTGAGSGGIQPTPIVAIVVAVGRLNGGLLDGTASAFGLRLRGIVGSGSSGSHP